jgi:hypothetical protein
MQSTAVMSAPSMVGTAIVSAFLGASVVFFVGLAVFDRFLLRRLKAEDNTDALDTIFVNAIERNGSDLRRVIDGLYAKELKVIDEMDGRIAENSNRNSWVDGQISTLHEQIVAQNDKLTDALDRIGDAIKDSSERTERTMEKNDRAIENLTSELGKTSLAVAKLEGFLKGWDSGDAPRRRRDD